MGLDREAFYRMTWTDYNRKCYGYERAQQVGYEQARWLAYWIVKSSMSKTDAIKSPIDLVSFNWEQCEKTASKPLSREKLEEIRNKLEGNGNTTDNSGNECAHIGTNSGAAAGA